MIRKNVTKILVGLAIFAGLSVGFTAQTFASTQSIVSKAAFESVRQCYGAGAIRAWFMATKPEQVLLNNGSSDTAKFPYGWTSATDNNLNCKSLMLGGDGFIGLIPSSAMNKQDKNAVKDYFTKIGYKSEDKKGDVDGKAKKVTYTIGDFECASGETKVSFGGKNTITFPTIGKTSDGKIKIIDPGDFSGGGNSYSVTSNCNGLTLEVFMDNSSDEYSRSYTVNLNGIAYSQVLYSFSGDEVVVMGDDLAIANNPLVTGDPSYINLVYKQENVSVPSNEVTDYKLIAPNYSGMLAGLKSNNAAGYSLDGSDVALTKQELFDLYTYYITSVYGARFAKEGDADFQGVDVNLCNSVKYKVDKTNAKAVSNVYGVDSSLLFNTTVELDGVISMLSAHGTYDDIDNGYMCTESVPSEENNNTSDPTDPGQAGNKVNTTEKDIVDCNQLTTIGAMQWILCPTMNNMQYATSWIDNMTQDWLQVDTSLYDGGSVDTIWGIIRNIANVIMVVILLVIIFSQLTGYGIDNYGIKKMLPRLIVMAIVINLSLYICQLAVDASNIFGSGLRDMFGSIAGSTSKPGESFLSGMIIGLFATANTGGAVAVGTGVTLATLGAPIAIAVVIAVIVLLLVILVAVIVLFLMLGAREIIVILCVVISPLAFAAYILPNTQNLFKKWWELFKAALIIFPICGAMSGISTMLRGLSKNADLHMWGYAILMILPYLGFFLMPMLLKNAISALGKVGGALTAMGQTFRGGGRAIGQGAMTVAKNTEAYKNIQNEALRRRQSDSADRTIARLQQIRDEGGQLTDAQTRRLARAQETRRKMSNEDTAARAILMERDYADNSMGDLLNDWNRAFDSGDTDTMDALTNVIVSRHGPGGTNAIAQQLANKTIFGADGNFTSAGLEASFNALRANMMQNSTLANTMQSKAADAYQMVMNGGFYEGDDGVSRRGNLADHSAHNAMATQTKDWASQSAATLRRAVDAGALTAEDAVSILNSTDPAVQSGIQSDRSKREVLQAAADGYRSGHNGNWSQDVVMGADGQVMVDRNGDNIQVSAVRAENYRDSVASANQAELDVRAADRAQMEQIASAVQQIGAAMQHPRGAGNTVINNQNNNTNNSNTNNTNNNNNNNNVNAFTQQTQGSGGTVVNNTNNSVNVTGAGAATGASAGGGSNATGSYNRKDAMGFGQRPVGGQNARQPRLPGPTMEDSNHIPRLPGPTAQ